MNNALSFLFFVVAMSALTFSLILGVYVLSVPPAVLLVMIPIYWIAERREQRKVERSIQRYETQREALLAYANRVRPDNA